MISFYVVVSMEFQQEMHNTYSIQGVLFRS